MGRGRFVLMVVCCCVHASACACSEPFHSCCTGPGGFRVHVLAFRAQAGMCTCGPDAYLDGKVFCQSCYFVMVCSLWFPHQCRCFRSQAAFIALFLHGVAFSGCQEIFQSACPALLITADI